jgi:hypothetical protein
VAQAALVVEVTLGQLLLLAVMDQQTQEAAVAVQLVKLVDLEVQVL